MRQFIWGFMDVYKELILIKNSKTKVFEDKTAGISHLKYVVNPVAVTYLSTNKTYTHNSSNVSELKDPKNSKLALLIKTAGGA